MHLIEACGEEWRHGISVGIFDKQKLPSGMAIRILNLHAGIVSPDKNRVAGFRIGGIDGIHFLKGFPVRRKLHGESARNVIDIERIRVLGKAAFAGCGVKIAGVIRNGGFCKIA